MNNLILLTAVLLLTSCKTLVINLQPKYEIAEVSPYNVQCVRIGKYPRRFIRSRVQFVSYGGCNGSLEIRKVRRRLNRRY